MGRSAILFWALALAIALLAVAAYAPGLCGPFLFDDFANLPSLGATGPVNTWPTFWRYITSGTADPTGRPVALLSFLLDAQDWPASPFPFKCTNLGLHVLNGLMVSLLLRGLGRAMQGDCPLPGENRRIDLAAVLGAGLWLLHPLLVSTTLYVVQREAMLSTLFVLIGLRCWLHARSLFLHGGRIGIASLWLTLGLGGCTALAILSKANGILLPTLALTVEYVLTRAACSKANPPTEIYKRWMFAATVVPTFAVAAYLAYQGWHGLTYGISAARPWTLGQRLLTEPRVLLDYLSLLWIPRPYTSGVFNDQIQASTSLLAPISTLWALLALMALAFGAWKLRKHHPAVAAAVLFYLVGHSLESTTIPLELYFEHRNYLPAILMFWPLARWICDVHRGTHEAASKSTLLPEKQLFLPTVNIGNGFRTSLAVLLVVGFAGMTHLGADLWGNARDQALLWAQLNPNSPRAQANAAQAEMAAGRPDHANQLLKRTLATRPDEVQLVLNLVAAQCEMGHVEPASLDAARYALAHTRDTGTLLASWFGRAIEQSRQPGCPEMDLGTVETLLTATMTNSRLTSQPGRLQDLYSLQGNIALARHEPLVALAAYDRALDQQVRPEAAFQQAAQLGSAGYPTEALAHLEHYQQVRDRAARPPSGMAAVHHWVLEAQDYWDQELAHLQATLHEDAERQAQAPS